MERKTLLLVAGGILLAACRDGTTPIAPSPSVNENQSEGRGFDQRLFAIGTSISAGTCSDGNVATCQNMSWVAQVSRIMHREPTLPFIGGSGCKSPLAAPIISYKRISGESVTIPEASLTCADNEPGVVLPTQNLAVPGALTQDALYTTPELRVDPYGSKLYRRILPAGETQVSAMEKQHPKFVTVELGANDILGIHSGVVIPGASFVPFSVWAPLYDAVLDRVGAVTRQALLVGLGRDIAQLSSLRRGNELWSDRAAFLAAFNVEVSADCDGNHNLLVVPILVPTAVANGLGRRGAGLSPYVFSCAAGAANVQDRILTPAEASMVNATLIQMSDHARGQAAARGYAFVDLEVLYGLAKPTFSVVALMTTGTPYGSHISLDGLHPSAEGHAILARAAARAIDDQYGIGLDGILYSISTSPSR